MAFVQPITSSARASKGHGKDCPRCNRPSRRAFLLGTGCTLAASVLQPFRVNAAHDVAASASAAEDDASTKLTFEDEDLCYVCSGRGLVPCQLCEGSGTFVVDDSVVVDRAMACPSCGGGGTIGFVEKVA
eukprot:Plantae.Rhodophyta-Palmaria_palmata.ctg24841.p2 GENE.Plantae.Rhodophyta-Palmaria_palmata.ctg24841~~Plantae.Rhodophyta-Palmaria_palmata.ctg24841.p2  ORF type:complete len:130 (-),score=19.59 Plantae.Rhodophyta-Palmaria_palmata.ctg24841:350-739(-)